MKELKFQTLEVLSTLILSKNDFILDALQMDSVKKILKKLNAQEKCYFRTTYMPYIKLFVLCYQNLN